MLTLLLSRRVWRRMPPCSGRVPRHKLNAQQDTVAQALDEGTWDPLPPLGITFTLL